MRIIPFLISLLITTALIFVLNIQLPVGTSKTPRLGSFLSPQHGCWQNAEPLNASFNASLQFKNLTGKTSVYFDERLVPHVYAENENDAYFIQGYLHAKFRLWQMEFQTHAAGGRLSEIMGTTSGGTDFLLIDRFFRRLGMVYAAENSLQAMEANPITKNEVDSYTAGINAYISALPENHIPLEYKLLDYKPELWTNMKTALFAQYMSWDLSGAENDFEMTNARKIFSSYDLEKLYPVIGDTVDPIIPRGTVFAPPGVALKQPVKSDSVYYNQYDSIQPVFDIKPDPSNGSNNWAVAGSKTKSGRPILCNDPHLGLNLPAIWYEMQISTPNYNAYGATFPGAPSVIIGFNDSAAWGFTNSQRDVKDYYDIRFNDTTMQEYWFDSAWRKTEFRKEIIKVKGKPDVVENIAMTMFGPVMYDHTFPNKFKDDKYYAVRWKAHDASNILLTFNKLDRAKNYADYSDAIVNLSCPGQNMLFATKSGDIGVTQQGEFPAKWRRQGDFIMPGVDSSYMWQGFIPITENPSSKNPVRGFVSSANQIPVDETYPYYLNGGFIPYRGWIINRKLNAMTGITVQDMQQIQTDNYNVFAEMGRPVLLKHIDQSKLDEEQRNYITQLSNWNLRNDTSETGATIFKVWWDSLEVAVYSDEFNQTKLPLRWPDESTLLESLLKDSAYKFADDIRTQQHETVAVAIQTSFVKAYNSLRSVKGNQALAWANYKATGVRHLLKIPSLSRLQLPVGGGEHIINATKQYHGPSWRMIVHLTDDVEAYAVYPGGQSGNPGSPFYDTFINTWAQGKYYKILFLPATESLAGKNEKIKWTMTFTKG